MNSATSYSRTMNGLTDIVADSVTTDTLTISNLTALDIVCNTLNAATSVTTDSLLSSTGTLSIPSKVNQSTGTRNVSYGLNSMNGTQTGTDNTSVGNGALQSLTSGNFNTAVGSLANNLNSIANNNTGIGYKALYNVTTSANTAVGANALSSLTTANATTAVGFFALGSLTSGTSNTACGLRCLETLSTGDANSGFGQQSLRYLTNGLHNTSSGYASDLNLGTGSFNCSYGSSTGAQNVLWGLNGSGNCCFGYMVEPSGSYNTLIGYQAGRGATRNFCNYSTGVGFQATPTGDHQIMLGTANEIVYCPNALEVTNYINVPTAPPGTNNTNVATTEFVNTAIAATTGVSLSGNNTFTGFNTFANKVSAYNDAFFNISYGYNAMSVNTNNGSYNHAFGFNSGNKLASSATNNTYFGYNTGANNISGTDCVFMGSGCGSTCLTNKNTVIGSDTFNSASGAGDDNVGMGYGVLKSLTSVGGGGYRNVSIGSRADEDLTTGSFNVSVGYVSGSINPLYATGNSNVHIGAGNQANGGSCNTFIGAQLLPPTITTSFSTAIGYNAKATNSNQIVLGTAADYIEGYGYMLLPTLPENSNNTKVVNAEYVDRAFTNLNGYNGNFDITDDFLTGLSNNPVQWTNTLTGSATGAITTSTLNHPGQFRFSLSTTVGSSSGITMSSSSIFTDNLTSVEWVWKYNTNYNNPVIQIGYANGINTFTVSAVFRLQLSPSSYQVVVNGTALYTFSTTGLTGNLFGKWLYGKIETNYNVGTQKFTLKNLTDNITETFTHSALVTSSLITPVCKISQLGSTIATLDVDYCRFKYTTTRI